MGIAPGPGGRGPVRWGILSTARIGAALIGAARASSAADIVAVASRRASSARAFADAHGIPRAHDSYEALLADPEVEAIYIPLPNGMHVDWTLRALEAGKHVLCEKPMDRRPARVARAFDLAQERGLVLTEGFMWRQHPQTKRLRALLDDGVVGDVRLVRASFSFLLTAAGGEPPAATAASPLRRGAERIRRVAQRAAEADVRLDPTLDGGALMDVGCYCVSGARLVAGSEPVSVSAQAVTGPSGVDTRLTGQLRFADGLLATFDCALDLAARHDLEVVGDEGRIVLADPWHCREPRIVLERGVTREIVEVDAADSYRLELDDASAAIRGEGTPLLGRDDALGQARTIEALYRSADEGRAVTLA